MVKIAHYDEFYPFRDQFGGSFHLRLDIVNRKDQSFDVWVIFCRGNIYFPIFQPEPDWTFEQYRRALNAFLSSPLFDQLTYALCRVEMSLDQIGQ